VSDEIDPITALASIAELEAMPGHIRAFVDAVAKLNKAGFNERLLVLMLHDSTSVPKGQIKTVLRALPTLAERFLEP
jgi:hypothetical protein